MNDINTINEQLITEWRNPLNQEDEIAHLSRNFLCSLKKSAQSSLDLARTVRSAHKLGPTAFGIFCKNVGYSTDASFLRKLRRIGEKESVFAPFKEILPPNWTTLYRLSKLSDGKLHSLLASGSITPSVTAEALATVVPCEVKPLPSTSRSSERSASLSQAISQPVPNGTDWEVRFVFPTLATAIQVQKLREFRSWLSDQEIAVWIGEKLEERLQNLPHVSAILIGQQKEAA